ncbi:MAG TPA: AAA family ATPase [Fimbriiglobus sp.]|jgi:hypothetical protein
MSDAVSNERTEPDPSPAKPCGELNFAVDWLWQPYLAFGTVAVLDGDPGVGKSFLTLDLAARLTSGQPMPDGKIAAPRDGGHSVLVVSAEDCLETTIIPRYYAAGGDIKRFGAFGGISNRKLNPVASFPRDFERLVESLCKTPRSFVILDPLAALVPQDVSANLDQAIRECLTPFAYIAAETRACFLFVRHLNKASGRRAIYRGSGSIGIAAAARSTLLAGKHPDDPDRRVLTQVKNNLGPEGPAIGFRLTPGFRIPTITWDGPTNLAPDDLVRNDASTGASKIAESWLRKLLAHGPVRATEVEAKALTQGISYATLRVVKKRLDVDSRRIEDGRKAYWAWDMPKQLPPLPDL